MIAEALSAYGCRRVVVSPGSRNVPLIMALSRSGRFSLETVIDGRSAAFVALGISAVSLEPVALVCTSGTAVLNYAPAVAEAYYRKLPLIVVSADRPAEMIDQDDSQTIRQPGVLRNFVKGECTICGELTGDTQLWDAGRRLNDVLASAVSGRRGPVHVNVSFSEPLQGVAEMPSEALFRKVELLEPADVVAVETARGLAEGLQGRRVLVVGGFHTPSARLSRALSSLGTLGNVAVVAEGIANLRGGNVNDTPDVVLGALSPEERRHLAPDVVISFGGSLVSRQLKQFLRDTAPAEHWHVGRNEMTIDCFRSLTRRIEIPAEGFFPRLAGAMGHLARVAKSAPLRADESEGYSSEWREASRRASSRLDRFVGEAPWSDLKAVARIVKGVPEGWNLQMSNGLSVRYAMLFPLGRFHRVDCNRGVSGIDGCVSTAVGGSLAYARGITLLVTGDMSMQYDLAALSSGLLTPRLRIVVVSNGGGGIFRSIKTTRDLPEREEFLACRLQLPLRELASAYGLIYLRADSMESLDEAVGAMSNPSDRPVLVEVVTSGEVSADVYRELFSRGLTAQA